MKSPLMKFSCGCIGISLEKPRDHNHVEVWLFKSCDGDTSMILGLKRPMPRDRVESAVPLTEEEFETIQRQMQQQLQAGSAMFDMVMSLERGKDYWKYFHGDS